MRKHLIRSGNGATLEIDEAELEELGVGETNEVDVTIEGGVLLVNPVAKEEDEAFKRAADKVNQRYEGLFRRLSK
jgi:antitoxin component of MazEF toxin-antitoxin module